jgi:large subunit ribosomal protein L10
MKSIIHFFMPKSRPQKEKEVADFLDNAKNMKSAVFIKYQGLSVKDERTLRKQLRADGNVYHALKKTLLTRCLKELKLDASQLLDSTGSFAVAFGLKDEVSAAKTLYLFSKKHESVVLVGGMYNGALIGKSDVATLATLPTRDELLAKLVYVVASPLRGMANVLAGPLRSLVQVLEAVRSSK